jgi:valyl-tRNA synthetase
MSKSKGQNIPPLELLDKYGPDAIRYWAAHTQPGSDSQIDFDVMEKGKKLINKLKNAGRFLEMHEDEGENEEYRREWISTRDYIDIQMGLHCNWFYSLGHLTAFFWKSFCDKYIEESKKTPANRTLRGIYDEMLDYFEIFMPNIRGICEQ